MTTTYRIVCRIAGPVNKRFGDKMTGQGDMLEVVLEPGANSLSERVAETAAMSLYRGPAFRRFLSGLSFDAGLELIRADGTRLPCTIAFMGRRIRVLPFLKQNLDVEIEVAPDTLAALAGLPYCTGLPLLWTSGGRMAVKALLRGGLVIRRTGLDLRKIYAVLLLLSPEDRFSFMRTH